MYRAQRDITNEKDDDDEPISSSNKKSTQLKKSQLGEVQVDCSRLRSQVTRNAFEKKNIYKYKRREWVGWRSLLTSFIRKNSSANIEF